MIISDEKCEQLRRVAEHPAFVDSLPIVALFLSLWLEAARFPTELQAALSKRDAEWRDDVLAARTARDKADEFLRTVNQFAEHCLHLGDAIRRGDVVPREEGRWLQELGRLLEKTVAA